MATELRQPAMDDVPQSPAIRSQSIYMYVRRPFSRFFLSWNASRQLEQSSALAKQLLFVLDTIVPQDVL